MIASVSTGISSANVLVAMRRNAESNTPFETANVTADVDTPQGRVMDPAENLRLLSSLYEGMLSAFEGEQEWSEDTTVIDYYAKSVRDLTEQLSTASGSARAQISTDLQAAQEGLAQARESKAAALDSFAERRQQMEPFLANLAQNIARFTTQIEAASATHGLDAKL